MPVPTVKLPTSGHELPRLAFGTGTALYNSAASKQVTMALNAGFRFVDGAEAYANEESAGEGIATFLKSSGLKRSDIYVLTKVGRDGMKDLQSAVKQEMQKLQVDYLDSYLLHLPPRGKDGLPTNVEAWKELEKIKAAGLTKSIGVSNWLASDIQQLLDAGLSVPDINQIEFHPYCYNHHEYIQLLALQKKHGIVTMTYSALAPFYKDALPEDGPLSKALKEIAAKNHNRTEPSVLLRWALQRSEGIITTTTSKESRAKEYLDQMDTNNDAQLKLSEDELKQIDHAGKQHGVEKYYMAPFLKP
ncbi:related to oxidoreductase, aldo/keto reductase family [Melanopsichium pennsylvanicum]|uniref:Related to oxidoreductase, aldo/keto reductase family n=2 Tax=Melanopsichium pennsylvanicum TaxID=63383 RepID=A0AAJ4XUD5_9BASI|nr:related to oxidoreductase, aldo/keto reductase family [Melanopsichium pennsylvanicum 4]SNX87818.1 related to oxidoreductase, aldo/keto reductase family [Melanopsichium pennsylvanicum]